MALAHEIRHKHRVCVATTLFGGRRLQMKWVGHALSIHLHLSLFITSEQLSTKNCAPFRGLAVVCHMSVLDLKQ